MSSLLSENSGYGLPLTSQSLIDAVRHLADRDDDLASFVDRNGTPPLWDRPPGFATLGRIILEQQVSLAAAGALFGRLEQVLPGGFAPEAVTSVGFEGLRDLGVTRQKAVYLLALSNHVVSGALPLSLLHLRSDEEAARILTSVRGIGQWTASIYLLMALRRPDVWPPADLALRRVLARLRSSPATGAELEQMAERWRPWRAVAARILWHAYLSDPAFRTQRRGRRTAAG